MRLPGFTAEVAIRSKNEVTLYTTITSYAARRGVEPARAVVGPTDCLQGCLGSGGDSLECIRSCGKIRY